MYYDGEGVSQNYAEAAKWFRRGAINGEPVAQQILGSMYFNGKGLTQNDIKAYMWLHLSAERGNAKGKKLRNLAGSLMAPEQIVEAKQLAQECQASN